MMTNQTATMASGKQSTINKIVKIVVILLAIFGLYKLAPSDDKNKPSDVPKASASSADASAPAPQPYVKYEAPQAAPSHNYALHEDGEYGYQSGISEEERNHGVATKALIMFRYLGEHNGVFTVETRDGDQRTTASCSEPCEFVKMRSVIPGVGAQEERVPNTRGSLINDVMSDAISGQLTPYQALPKE